MKKLFAYIIILLSLIASFNIGNNALADPATHAGQPCTLTGGAAGTWKQQSGGALYCVENNPAGGKEPKREIAGNGTSTDAEETRLNSAQSVKGTCNDIKGDGQIISSGFVSTLCTGGNEQTAIQSIIENLTNYILNIGVIIFAIMIGLGMVQVMTGGASPEALKAGKKRIFLAASSIALFFAARATLDLIGITGGRFLNVDLNNFDQNTILELIAAAWQYIQFFGGALAVTMIVVGGIRMMTAGGNPQQIQTARKIITYAVIGLLGVASASLIFSLISKVITG
jgi:hypothetical protein